jgi:uncharacterized protein (TIGR02270 family)
LTSLAANPDRILWDVVEEHLDEAAFLFERWEQAVVAPHYSADELERLVERRLRAHLDGLVIAGAPAAERLLVPALSDPDCAAACALALLASPAEDVVDGVLASYATTEDDAQRRGLARALAVTDREGIDTALRLATYSTEGPAQAGLLDILAARRIDPGAIVGTLLRRDDATLLAATLRAAAVRAPDDERVRVVEALLESDVPEVAAAATETAMVWGFRPAWERCLARARAGAPWALRLVALLGGASDAEFVRDMVATRTTSEERQSALVAFGYAGRIDGIETCLALLGDEDELTARLAGEAFCAITGLRVEKAFTRPAPADDDAALPSLDKDLETDLEPTPEDDLALPDPVAFANWWQAHRHEFEAGTRYLRGRVYDAAAVGSALRDGPMRRTEALALELLIRTHGAVCLPAPRLGHSVARIAGLTGHAGTEELGYQGRVRWL